MSAKQKKFPENLRAGLTNLPKQAKPETAEAVEDPAFIEDLIRRGEAVRREPGKELPPGATHELIVENGRKKVIRLRYSGK